ncbi:type VII secretion target [Kitasatospora sp. NPDC090091]|uniref:type VII secretion target n=1 Tax=Kitasatospora sp. NPDC090091 TaxID=3364081 RepID=UPI0037FF4448
MAGYTVRPDELDGAGKAGKEVAGQMRAELPASTQEHYSDPKSADAPSNGLYGWKVGSAADRCWDVWHTHLTKLAGQLDDTAGILITTAENYRKAEQTGVLRLDGTPGGAQ